MDRRTAVAALVLAIPALGACGFNAQTDQPYQPAVGANDRNSNVDVLGAVVVSNKSGTGNFIVTLVNNDTSRPDKLVSIQGNGVQVAAPVTPQIPPEGKVNLADKSVGGVLVKGTNVVAGGYVTLRLNFTNADPVTVDVPVITDTGPYVGLAPSASASPSSTPSSGSSSSPSASASASPAG